MKTSPQSDLRGFFSSSASTGLKVFVKKLKREGRAAVRSGLTGAMRST
ncbi:hypothetical protein RJO15_15845 [Herbaspirillum huttiense F1]|nr:hypothetical protein [Herbaspirillum huttiense]MDT0357257.1 hypothetical protein [Herbaspirillum huttiense F1]